MNTVMLNKTKYTLEDISGDSDFQPLDLIVETRANRLEITLPDGQILGIEKFLGEVRLVHWTEPDNDNSECIIIPLT